MHHHRNLPLKAGLAMAGLTYCQIFAHIEINPFLKNYLILVPIQLGVLMYFGYAYWSGKSNPHQTGRPISK